MSIINNNRCFCLSIESLLVLIITENQRMCLNKYNHIEITKLVEFNSNLS